MSAPAFDRDDLLERVDGDRELLAQLVELFSRGLPALLGEIQSGLESGRGEQVTRAAHTLKGALLNLSAGPSVALARELEESGRRMDQGSGSSAFDRLRSELRRLEQALAAEAEAAAGGGEAPGRKP